jgi:hypothetical protein
MRKPRVPIVLSFLTLIALVEFCLCGEHQGKTVAVPPPLKEERKIHVLFGFDNKTSPLD